MVRNRIIPIFVSHAGCPHQCVFCNQMRIAGDALPLTGEAVRAALENGVGLSHGAECAFYGGSFTALEPQQQEELLEAVQPFLDRGAVSSIRLSTRPDAIDEKTVSRLTRFGVRTVELGSQSMDAEVLRRSGRGHTAEDTVRAVSLLKTGGLSVVLQMMTGLPGSTEESDLRTAEQLIALRPNGVRIYPTVVVRGTPLFDLYEQGRYVPQTTEAAAILCAELYRRFTAAGIPVLRMGLQPTETLSAGDAVAGPYHPAFGELVKSRLMLEHARTLLASCTDEKVTLLVRRDRISAMVGQQRANLQLLRQEFPEKQLKVAAGTCEEWEIRLQSDEKIDTIT